MMIQAILTIMIRAVTRGKAAGTASGVVNFSSSRGV